MIKTTTSAEQDLVSCEVCLKEVPRSEAAVPEATDYVVYFCGLGCYQQWKAQQAQDPQDPQDPQARSIGHE